MYVNVADRDYTQAGCRWEVYRQIRGEGAITAALTHMRRHKDSRRVRLGLGCAWRQAHTDAATSSVGESRVASHPPRPPWIGSIRHVSPKAAAKSRVAANDYGCAAGGRATTTCSC